MEELILSVRNDGIGMTAIALGFLFCFLFSAILSTAYVKHRLYTALELEPKLLIFIALVTFLIVVVIQDSLMLSLGMVGALSIVRFRSPIKNTMDLGYIFFAVAIGVGFASGKLLISLLITTSIMVLLYFVVFRQSNRIHSNSNESTERDRVWIAQLDCSGDLSEALKLFENIKPDGFSYRDGRVEIRLLAHYEKVKNIEEQLMLDGKVKIKSLSAI